MSECICGAFHKAGCPAGRGGSAQGVLNFDVPSIFEDDPLADDKEREIKRRAEKAVSDLEFAEAYYLVTLILSDLVAREIVTRVVVDTPTVLDMIDRLGYHRLRTK